MWLFYFMNNKKCIKFLQIGTILISVLGLGIFTITLILSGVKNDWTLLYGFIICFFTSYLSMFLSWYIPNKTIDLGLTKANKKKAVFLFVTCYIFKYILIVLPILIGQIINVFVAKEMLFNGWVMLITTLIYPLSIMLTKFWFIKKTSPKNDKVISEHSSNILVGNK